MKPSTLEHFQSFCEGEYLETFFSPSTSRSVHVCWYLVTCTVFKGRLVGLFQRCSPRLIVLLPQMGSFIHLQRRHAPYRRERPLLLKNYYQGIWLANPEFTKVLGSFTCRKAGIWDRFFHFPSEKSNGFGRL